MAEVVVEQGSQTPTGAVGDVAGFLAEYWWVILLLLLIVILVAIVFVWLRNRKLEDLRKDLNYVEYERVMDAAQLNREKLWIKKIRRWWWLLFGIPTAAVVDLLYLYVFLGEHWWIFWTWTIACFLIYIPFIWFRYEDRSMRVLDVDNRVVARYRGHCTKQDGYIYMLCVVGKKWFFLDDYAIIKLPSNVLSYDEKEIKDKNGKKSIERTPTSIKIDKYIWNERENYMKIPMVSLVKEDDYYYLPTLVEGLEIIDLREKIANSMYLRSGIQLAFQNYSDLSKVMDKAINSDVGLKFLQKTPVKQQEVNTGTEQQNSP